MSSGFPPTYYFNGITFNPSFYQSDDDYLTIKSARSSFLTYPMSQGDELFASNITLKSTLTDTSGDVGTLGQFLSSTTSGVNWMTPINATYQAYSASATLPTAVQPVLLVIVSGTTVGKVITIPSGYLVGQKIQIKNTGSVVASISTVNTVFIYSSTSVLNTITLESGDVVNLIYNGFTWIQYAPSNRFSKTLCPTYDAVADATAGNAALTIGSNVVVGNIVIGAALSAGDISIATAQASGGTVSIGSGFTETTLSGTVLVSGGGSSGTTGIIVGKTGYDTVGSNFTIPATINSTYILRITGGSPNINLPTAVIGQTIIIRSITTGAVTINATASAVIFAIGSAVSAGSLALATAGTVRLYATTALQWIQI